MLNAGGPGLTTVLVPHGAQLPGIHECILDPVRLQRGEHPVGGKPLGDAVQGDRHILVQAYPLGRDLQLTIVHPRAIGVDGVIVGKAPFLLGAGVELPQRLHGHVERAAGLEGYLSRALEHGHEVGMRVFEHALAVELADLALRPIEAHDVLDQLQLIERGAERAFRRLPRRVERGHGHVRAQGTGSSANTGERTAPDRPVPQAEPGQSAHTRHHQKQFPPSIHGLPPSENYQRIRFYTPCQLCSISI